MDNLISSLFALEGIAHLELFKTDSKPWLILNHLISYIESFPLLGQIKSEIPKSVTLTHPESIFIDEGVTVGPNVVIEGPCLIGKGVEIRSNAFIRAGCILEEGSLVGHCSEVKGAILLPHAKAPHFNYVGDSIIGHNVNLGAGVTCANFRLDHKEISLISSDGKRVPSGRKKLGAIIGDDSQIGCQSVINPGTILKRKTLIRPLTSVSLSNINHFL